MYMNLRWHVDENIVFACAQTQNTYVHMRMCVCVYIHTCMYV